MLRLHQRELDCHEAHSGNGFHTMAEQQHHYPTSMSSSPEHRHFNSPRWRANHVATEGALVPACHCAGGTTRDESMERPCQHELPTWTMNTGALARIRQQRQPPTWSRTHDRFRTCELPCQQPPSPHPHHHHYHRHQHQWSDCCCCCCLPSASSPSSPSLRRAGAAEYYPASVPSSHVYNQQRLLQPHTHVALPVCTCFAHPSSQLHCTTHTEKGRKLAPAIAPAQHSTLYHDVDLYAAPTRPLKRPKRHMPKLLPPLPSPASPPYVTCQHCSQLLCLPLPSSDAGISMHSSVYKLRCALCMRISFFLARPKPEPPLSNAGPMGAFNSASDDSAGDRENAESQFKKGVKKIMGDADEPSIMPSKKGASRHAAGQRWAFNVDNGLETGKQHEHRHANAAIDSWIVEQTSTWPEMSATSTLTGQCREEPPRSPPPKLNPEFAGFNSVQDWVNSLEKEVFSFSQGPAPVRGTGFVREVSSPARDAGFGSGILLEEPLDWQSNDRRDGADLPVPGSPLHKHFGYQSARDLLNKTFSSEDEVKVHPDVNSSPSTSNASANTFKPPDFDTAGESVPCSPLKQGAKDHVKSSTCAEQDDQSPSLARLLMRSFKGFGERKHSPFSGSKSRVVVNGHALSDAAIKRAEERSGKLQPGGYWYDSTAGFWGVVGGPCCGVLPAFIEELHYPMTQDCSNGDTQVFVNGRELHHKDLAILSHRGLSKKPGRAYVVSFDGSVVDEMSGQELKHLGKLAPTVEKRGRGFGMHVEKFRR